VSEENVAQDIPAPDQPTLVDAPKVINKPSKIDQKRQKIFQDRMKRFMSKGMTPEQAISAMQREDYDRLPPDQKIRRLESALVGNFQQVARDIGLLRQNQNDLADVMDVNFRAFEKMLIKLGVPSEDQKALLKEAEDEIRAERLATQLQAKADAEMGQQQSQEQMPPPDEEPQAASGG
jgi:hypothetical protein